MDLNDIVVFTKVVETKSFTGAADALGLPKSTVSRKLAQLEERLGVRLVQRTTRKLALTEIGEAYYERCSRIVADIRVSLAEREAKVASNIGLILEVVGDPFCRFIQDFAEQCSVAAAGHGWTGGFEHVFEKLCYLLTSGGLGLRDMRLPASLDEPDRCQG